MQRVCSETSFSETSGKHLPAYYIRREIIFLKTSSERLSRIFNKKVYVKQIIYGHLINIYQQLSSLFKLAL